MEFSVPTWNSQTTSYTFQILQSNLEIATTCHVDSVNSKIDLPACGDKEAPIVQQFLFKTQKYFTNPLTAEKVLRHLRSVFRDTGKPTKDGWYEIVWKPIQFVVKSGDFQIVWEIASATETVPRIPAEFTAQTPRATTPESPEQPKQVRTIQIHDSLIPVGDLPLSDLPPISFPTEEADPTREESKRRVREARLKVALAKLKAQRMEQKYYERYGQTMEESEDSSEFSSDSEEELPFERGLR